MRPPPPDDIRLWRQVMREVAPLPGRPRHPLPDPPPRAGEGSARSARERAEVSVNGGARPASPLPPLDHFAGIDRGNAERLKRGQRAIEARLDLHGMTQTEAHAALYRFITGSRAAGRRCVLVITGHGRLSGGILKQSVPRWLHEPSMRRDVLAIAPAQRQHGGAGALYVLLRRMRGAD